MVTTFYKQKELIKGLVLTWKFSCHWVIFLCHILSSCYDLIMHNSFGIGSLQLCLLQVSNHLKTFAKDMHVAKQGLGVCLKFDNHREKSEWKHLLKTIFWFSLDWTKIDTNTVFFRYLKKGKQLALKAWCSDIIKTNTTQGNIQERVTVLLAPSLLFTQ